MGLRENIDQWLIAADGRAIQTKWKDGNIQDIPFDVSKTLDDFDGDQSKYSNYLLGLGEKHLADKAAGKPMKTDFEDFDEWQSALHVWEIKQAQRELIAENTPPPPPQISIPRDEHRAERIRLYNEIHEWESKLEEAKRMGDSDQVDRAKDYIRWAKKDLEAIPESKFQIDAKKAVEGEITDLVAAMLDKNLKDDPLWNDENVRHNAAQALEDFNKRSTGLDILLPIEKSRGSRNYEEIRSGSVQQISFPDERTKQDFLFTVYECGMDPHDYIRGKGLGGYLKTGDEPEGKVEEERPAVHRIEKERDPWSAYIKPQEAFAKFRESGVMPKEGLIEEEQGEQSQGDLDQWKESLQPYGNEGRKNG